MILPSLAAKEAAGSSLQGREKSCCHGADEKRWALPTITADSVQKSLAEGRFGWGSIRQGRCCVDGKLLQLGI